MKHDPRITPWRDGIAARSLEGVLEAEVYLDPRTMSCGVAAAAIRAAPDAGAEQVDQLLFGERFEVIEEEGAWLWGQAARDGYVGFVEAAALAAPGAAPTHRVGALRTYAFAEASIKSLLDHLGHEMGRLLEATTGASTTRYGKTYGRPAVLRLEPSRLESLRLQMEATAGEAKWMLGQIEREKEKLTKDAPAGVQPGVVARLTRELGESGEWVQSVRDTLTLLATDDSQADSPIARWVTRDGQGHVEIHVSPVDASGWLANRVWRNAFGAIATSATLRSMGDFHHFAERSGLSRVRETVYVALPSPFDLENTAVLRVPVVGAAVRWAEHRLADLPGARDVGGFLVAICRRR